MADDKKTESLAALKNANRHLSDVFTLLTKKDAVLQSAASDLSYVAGQCGDIMVKTYTGNQQQVTPLKVFLGTIVSNLNGARN